MDSEDRLTLLGIIVVVSLTTITLWQGTLNYKERTAHCGPVWDPSSSTEGTY